MALPNDEAPQASSLGRYHLIASLGQGGMANVYLAVVGGPGSFSKLMVLKALRSDVQAAPEFIQMFLDEARLSARFNHPNIVQAYEVGEANGTYFIAMEYLDGQTLRSVQRKFAGAFPLEEELRVLADTARGLHYAHELRDFTGVPLNVVHRDVSPQNIFLTYDGQVKLLDFGIAKAVDSEHLTQVGLIKGKIEYIAPEQARGDPVDRRADVFALGAMAWEAVTRQRFAGGPNLAAVTKLHKRLTGGEPDVLQLQPEAPEKLVRLIRRALALDPAYRFETAAAFATEIDEFLDSMNLRPSPMTLRERLARPFMAERARINSVIEEQLKRLGQRGVQDSGIPRIERTDLTLTLSGSSAGTPSRPGGVLPSATPLRQRLPQSRRMRTAVALGAVAIGGAVALVLSVPPSQPSSQPIEATGAIPSAKLPIEALAPVAPAPTPQPEMISLRVEVEPATADARLDDVALATTPFEGRLRRDGQVHYVEASAPGFEKTRLAVTFDRDRSLHLQLKPALAPSPALDRPARAHVESRREARAATESGLGATPASSANADLPGESSPGSSLVSRRKVGTHIDKANPYLD
ncbi:MAG TPA: protein kinase [Polyangiales bacterium]